MNPRRTYRQIHPALVAQVRSQVERCGCSGRPHVQVEEFLRGVEHDTREALHWSQVERGGSDRVERADVPFGEAKRRGERKVAGAALWRMLTHQLYGSNDLVALATRESLQNSVDAIRAAVRSRDPKLHIEQGTGFFTADWTVDSNGRGTLTFEDNGIGMDETTLDEKFLTLGASGKEGDIEMAGGFGAAKAVILGVTPTGRWDIHTRNVGARAIPGTMSQDFFDMPLRKGTKITLYDIPTDTMSSQIFGGNYYPPEDRIKMMLGFSDIPDIRVLFNGQVIEPTFPRRRGHGMAKFGSGVEGRAWGVGNEVQVKSYRRMPGTGSGNYYVRLNGLIQFVKEANVNIPADLIFDLKTTLRPDDKSYPLTASRDRFQSSSSAYSSFYYVTRDYEREVQAEDKPQEKDFDTLLPSSDDRREQEGAAEFEDALKAAADDPDFLAMVTELAGAAAEFYEEQAKHGHADTRGTRKAHAEDDQPTETGAPGGDTERASGFADFRDRQAVIPKEDEVASPEGRQRLGDAVTDFIKDAKPGADTSWDEDDVVTAARKLKAGQDITPEEARALLDAIKGATEQQEQQPGESTMTIVLSAAELSKLVAAAAAANPRTSEHDKAAVKAKARAINPFGAAAIVKISRKNYDRPKAKRFIKNTKKYIPHLVVWDMTLRLIAKEGKLRIPFQPGFVLDDTVRAMASSEGEAGSRGFKSYVMVHPDFLDATVKAHKDRPHAIAAYLHHIACHELTHLPRMGLGHCGPAHAPNDEFIVQREDLGVATGHLLPAIEQIVVKAFKLEPRSTKALKAPTKAQVREAVKEATARLRQRITELESKVKLSGTENVRLQAIVDTGKSRLHDTIRKLQALVEYHEFRVYLAGPGSTFLPAGVTAKRLLDLVDQHTDIAVDVILGSEVAT